MSVFWHVFTDADAVCRALCDVLIESAERAIESRRAFHVVLAGGETPRRLYERMRNTSTDWAAWHIYFCDERHLLHGHPARNDTMISRAWFDHVPLRPEHVHFVRFHADVAAAAGDYARTLNDVAMFDFTLLGLGEDGHTASLFPGNDLGESPDSPAALPVLNAPKPPAQRVTLSVNRLNASRRIAFLVTGAAKRPAIRALRDGEKIPGAAIRPASGSVEIYADDSAAGGV